jgi:flagellar basal-body rod protein FlgB
MFENLKVFQTAGAMARYAGERQAVIAQNIANADTPGYRAREVSAFADTYRSDPAMQMRSTRSGHLHSTSNPATAEARFSDGEPSPNGNTVSLEEEMLNATATQQAHAQALAIYKHAMTVLRTSIGR